MFLIIIRNEQEFEQFDLNPGYQVEHGPPLTKCFALAMFLFFFVFCRAWCWCGYYFVVAVGGGGAAAAGCGSGVGGVGGVVIQFLQTYWRLSRCFPKYNMFG